jgi:hypothetical protein
LIEPGDSTEAIIRLCQEGCDEEGEPLTTIYDEDGSQIGYFFTHNLKETFDFNRKTRVVRMTMKAIS